MAALRRHWAWSVITCLLLVAIGIFSLAIGGPVHGTASFDSAMVERLRGEVGMTNGEMARLGCSREMARAILDAIGNWQSANAARLAECDSAVAQTQAELQNALRELNCGTTGASFRLEAARRQSTLSREAYAALLSSLVNEIGGTLGNVERQRWSSMRQGGAVVPTAWGASDAPIGIADVADGVLGTMGDPLISVLPK